LLDLHRQFDGGRDGAVTFADLKVGWRVTVRATRQDSTITASDVVVEQRGAIRMEIDGRVPALSGSCPALTFIIGATRVSTGASTVFSGQSCAQLANGVSVIVDGTR
jgi:hypothetical protein